MNKNSFVDKFNILLTALRRRDMTQKEIGAQIQVYYQCLKGIPDDLWAETIQTVLATADFFPTIHEICNAVGDTEMRREGRPQAEDAWLETLEILRRGKSPDSVSYPDIAKAVTVVGGWNMIGSASIQYTLNDYKRSFVGYYNQLAENRRRSAVAFGPTPGAEQKVLAFPTRKVSGTRQRNKKPSDFSANV